jgi:enoyl-CoA hydratase
MIHLAISKGLAEVVLDRPKVNAMSSEMLLAIERTFAELSANDQVAAVLLRAEGRSFSAGLDLIEVAGLADDAKVKFIDTMERAFVAAFRLQKPMAAAVQGHAIAGGLVLALCADFLAFASGDYKVGLTELAVGVPLPRSAWEIVELALAPRALRQLVFGAGTHPPGEVFALGVGDALVADPVQTARSWLEQASARPAATFRHVKALHRQRSWARIEHSELGERQRMLAALGLVKR